MPLTRTKARGLTTALAECCVQELDCSSHFGSASGLLCDFGQDISPIWLSWFPSVDQGKPHFPFYVKNPETYRRQTVLRARYYYY